jgi:subtilase family serine protease
MNPRNAHRLATFAIATVLTTALVMASGPAAAASSRAPDGTVTIANTLPRWLPRAEPSTARMAAPESLNIRVYLAPNGGLAALQAKAAALSDPSSADFRKWLSTADYAAQFAPSQAAVDAISEYLTSAGLAVTGVEAAHRYVAASGSIDQLNQAFGVTLGSYSHDGQTVTAPSTAVTLPAAVGASVLTVTGLDTTVTTFEHDHLTADEPADVVPPAGFVNARPCNIDFGTVLAKFQADYKTPLPKFKGKYLPYAPCGYTGPQLRAAYEGGTELSGTGATVGITDAYRWQNIASDANTYAENHGDGSYVPGQLTESLPDSYNGEDACDPSGWSGEETLDVEAVHAMAPTANIRYYASASCYDSDFLDTLARVVDENVVQVVSNSWSDVEQAESGDSVAAYEQVILQGAVQGISFLWSSGDNGDELAKTGVKQVDYPASDPYATAVGGTATEISSGKIISQTGWGTQKYSLSADGKSWVPLGFLYGAGGGYSALFNQPSYQNGVVPASAPAGRAVPDVAMDADPSTGMLIGQTQTFPDGVHYGEYRIGGTSLASPLFAGMLALTIQQVGTGLGLLNPVLYKTKRIFTDVKQTPSQLGVVRADYANGIDPADGILYSVRTFGQDSSLALRTGWDPVTGLGVPNGSYLAALAAPSLAAAPAGSPEIGAPQR